ncbi:MAG: hypothetical protein WBP80_11075, partial [Planifilum fulgidum]
FRKEIQSGLFHRIRTSMQRSSIISIEGKEHTFYPKLPPRLQDIGKKQRGAPRPLLLKKGTAAARPCINRPSVP